MVRGLSRVDIIDIESVECVGDIATEEFISIARKILAKGGVDEPIVVVDGRVVNTSLCLALKKLGVKRVPISRDGAVRIFIPLEALGFYSDIKPNTMRVFRNSLELLYGNWPTPLVKLERLSLKGIDVWAKLEWYNPFSGSIKDRIAWYMFVQWIERHGPIAKLYEVSSGNTGLALASISAIHGASARIYLPSTAMKAVEVMLRVLGAEVVRSSKELTTDILKDVEMEAIRDSAVMLNQFNNDANFEAHLRYTAKELDLQLREAGIVPRAIVAGTGTSGHLAALALYFKSRYGGYVKVFGVQPAPNNTIPGLRRANTGSKWLNYVDIDDLVDVTLEEAVRGSIEVARNEGLLIGLSSGAVVAGFRKLVESGVVESPGSAILIFPDSGFKYVEVFETYIRNSMKTL